VTPCKLRRIAAPDLIELLKGDACAAWHVLSEQLMCMRNDLMHATSHGCLPLRVRLAQVLGMLLDAQADRHTVTPVRLRLPVRHWELAQFLAVTPEHLSRVLKELVDEGVVRRDKGWLLVDPARLRAIGQRH
jgi:CRP-like cAMP-binding protein